MIVGGGLSAEDFVLQCHKYGSKSIHWASRRLSYDYITANLPTNVKVHPLPIKFHENNGVTFSDSVIEHKVDMIVFCTGYLKHYPFLEEPLRLMSPSAIFPKSLYRGVAFQPNPKLMYIGMGNYNFSQVIIDIQAHLARDLIDGRHQVPKDLGMKPF
jgi:trimethylamine monooxygenase